MADLVLGVAKSLVEGTLTKAQSAIDEESRLRQSSQRDLVFIAGEFQMMQSFLSITTQEQVRNNVVSTWVTQVRDLSYDVEDGIEFVVHLDTKSDWWRRLIPSCMRRTLPLDEAVDIIEKLKARVQDVSHRNARYNLISDSVPRPDQPQGRALQPAAEARDTAWKQPDMEALTRLISKKSSDHQVISVWVPGGDLAAASIIRKAYDNPKSWGIFRCRAWVNLVRPLNLPDYLILQQELDNRKYLVVLEDVSTIEDWNTIRRYLPDRRNGSRIVVLTQKFQVASFCTGHPYIQRFWADYSLCVFSKEGSLIGRMSEINELPEYLAKTRINALQVMSVWGISGAGKSALVRNLYHNKMLHANDYEKYIWVDVSHPFKIKDFCQSLLLQFRSNSLEANEDPVKECYGLLKDHRCLVVIDNLQSTEEWDLIQDALAFRPSESAIIVITNEEIIALHCADRKDLVFNVKALQVGAAVDLFKKEVERDPYLPVNGIENDLVLQRLISMSGGLPNVIVAIADYLAQDFSWQEKARILNEKFIVNLETRPEFACLRDLFGWIHSFFRSCPDYLKPCIFYLSIFPKSEIIRRRRLVMRWVAEGYSKDKASDTAEENGEELFAKIIELSMIQPPEQTIITNMRMVSCRVSAFFHEYIISRPKEENVTFALEVFALKGCCRQTTGRTGRHLVIEDSWERDRIVFKSIDFSRLRSLTVSGKWESFFISNSMKVLRVLDLENASGVTDKDLKKMLKLLPRLKFLSLRGCSEISDLPSSVGDLRQLQILDVRYTSIVTMPASITKLNKLQYIRAGTTAPPEDASTPRSIVFKVASGVGNLTALHTLGVVNVGAAGGKDILKEVRNLTQLRKLGVSGISKKNSTEFFSAISGHAHLQSLSVWLKKKNQDCLDAMHPNTVLPKKLQSLKLYGLAAKLPVWINQDQLCNIRKLNFETNIFSKDDVRVLGGLQQLCILRLRVKQLQDGELNFRVMTDGVEERCYVTIKVLEIASRSNLHLIIGSVALQNLELLKAGCCCSGSLLRFAGLKHLSKLKEVQVISSHDDKLKEHLEEKIGECTSKPALTTLASAGGNNKHCSFPFFPTTQSSPAMQASCQ